ncbi:(2Fe-2S)-binding protein [Leisingera sp. ANG-M1]|uniref:aromatic ring-hydroxylating oxygenase subunit alpha n=1 Tax=Leisingera sp. ANG-M1 TaxID=1577895 RepID=UPI00057CFEB8|nr:aromatic ring-hydroxylating dioxygenase subunit alpha [Leisingera sp. ANG-M1]KIC07680.1 (2Fe-2S)-binding protein [Leisingera sp. ANG-M1]
MTHTKCTDPVVLEQWHPLISDRELADLGEFRTTLLERPLTIKHGARGIATVTADGPGASPKVLQQYGYVWASFGQDPNSLFPFPEFEEPDRRFVPTGVFGVNVSAGRAVENFLDMGHFPYVHTGILGEEPHTEVKEYDVEVSETRDEVVATRCRFYQPKAALASDEGADVEYTYRVPHPNCALLYKSSPADPSRRDVIYLFLQPMGEEWVRAHTGMCILDEDNTDESIRYFQQVIFGQDKPILENQHPKRLPLDPRAETPIRADKTAIAYRRWLSQKGLTYGVISVAA